MVEGFFVAFSFSFCFTSTLLYKALNAYINIDMSAYVQFYSDTARYPIKEKDILTLKKNYARTNTFKFSFLKLASISRLV